MNRENNMTVTSIRLHPEVEAPLEKLAKNLDRSKNYLINQALKEFIARQAMEEARWLETLPALDSIQAGKSVASGDVFAWLENWGTDRTLSKPK